MRKRISKYKHLHSNRFRYLSSSIPLICASGLLLVCGMMINPVNNISEKAHAASTTTGGATTGGSGDDSEGDDTTTPSIVMGIDNSDTTLIGQVNSTSTPGSITRNMTITASNVDKYAVYVQSNDNNNGQLVGQASGGRVGQITSTDGVILGSIPDNTWGYALAEGENLTADNTNLKYKAVTSSVDATNPAYSTTTPEGTKKFTLAFGVKFADSANPDHYKADVLVSVAANPGEVTTRYSITYDGNGNTGGEMPIIQKAETANTSYTFKTVESNFIKNGYKFAGWGDTPNATIIKYKPGSIVTLSSVAPNKTLYAIWSPTTITGIANMQDLTTLICGASDVGSSKQLKDTRDQKMYWVTKLKDGNCWMTQNLDYDDPQSVKITSTSGLNGGPASGEWDNNASTRQYWDPGIGKTLANGKLVDISSSSNLQVGNYYSWAAATDGGDGGAYNKVSICPQGWELPMSGGSNSGNASQNGSFAKLFNSYTGLVGTARFNPDAYNIQPDSYPFYFTIAGEIREGALDATNQGFYWSRYKGNATHAYNLHIIPNYLIIPNDFTSTHSELYNGMPVRCLVVVGSYL